MNPMQSPNTGTGGKDFGGKDIKVDKTRVIFRKFKDGDIIAFMPDLPANLGMVESYLHFGQHGEADYYGLLPITRLATPAEYFDLEKELEGIGYDLEIRQKLNWK